MGSNEEFAAAYEREIEKVLIFLARRTLDVALAADLAAETFALAFCGWSRLEGRSDEEVRAWLFTVARRQVSRYFRRARAEQRAVRRLHIQVPVVHEDDIELIDERAGLRELRAEVSEQLARLNPEHRDAVRLRVVEERPYPDVAMVLGISEQAARARVSRGLRSLRAVLGGPHGRQELYR
jgi:RNA polymerase sigma-70 factor (ECF subfamily)